MTGTDAHTTGRTRRDAWMFRTMNDPRLRRLHATRPQRRRLVAAHLILSAAMVAALASFALTGRLWWTAPLIGALLLWIPVTATLNSMTRGLLELRTRMLDERQLDERGTVHTLAHRASLATMLLAFAGLTLAHRADVVSSGLVAPVAVTGLAVLLVHWLLPLWIAALRAQDEPPADDVL